MKWEPIAKTFVSDVIILLHRFIVTILDLLYTDKRVRNEIWLAISDEVPRRYKRGIDQAAFLLKVEIGKKLLTNNCTYRGLRIDSYSSPFPFFLLFFLQLSIFDTNYYCISHVPSHIEIVAGNDLFKGGSSIPLQLQLLSSSHSVLLIVSFFLSGL